MADIEAPDNDVLEQEQPPADPARPLASGAEERDLEAPEADAVEQSRPLRSADEGQAAEERSVETDPADAADRDAVVDFDDEEYR